MGTNHVFFLVRLRSQFTFTNYQIVVRMRK